MKLLVTGGAGFIGSNFIRYTLAQHPEVGRALDELAGRISEPDMLRLNYAVDAQHRNVKDVVREFLRSKGL